MTLSWWCWSAPASHIWFRALGHARNLSSAADGRSRTVLIFGHFFIFMAYRRPTGVVAPFYYCFTVWAVISGLIVFQQFPNALAVSGILLVVASGLTIVSLTLSKRRLTVACLAAVMAQTRTTLNFPNSNCSNPTYFSFDRICGTPAVLTTQTPARMSLLPTSCSREMPLEN